MTAPVDTATIAGGVVAALAIASSVRRTYLQTLGRRRDHYRRLNGLTLLAQLSHFEYKLGTPPTMRKVEPYSGQWNDGYTECLFTDRDYTVQTVSDRNDSVILYSITTRSSRFAPKLRPPANLGPPPPAHLLRRNRRPPLLQVRLGRTRLSELRSPGTWHGNASGSGREFHYSETQNHGVRGYYNHYVFTASSRSYNAPFGYGEINRLLTAYGHTWSWPGGADWDTLELVHEFRKNTVITTYSVTRLDWDELGTYWPPGTNLPL